MEYKNMHNYKKQTQPKKSLTFNVVCALVAVFAIAYAIGEHRTAEMVQYAAQNDCEWVYQGTWYGDSRDYTCK